MSILTVVWEEFHRNNSVFITEQSEQKRICKYLNFNVQY